SDAVIELLPSGEIINANKSVSNTLGYESEELIGTNFFDLIFPEYRSVFQTRIKVGMESIIYQKLITENLILFRGKTKLNRIFSFESFFFPFN
ncbi:MAG TPA: PAS domain S-box protein, partial [Candidatus Aminicenantes bacterium]|nr:PAS domain S-box protein [Candidatus Aminicenantes bacterium]